MNYYGSICLSDIPKEVIKEGKNGKKYLNITVWERKLASEWGHTHMISCAPKPEERKDGTNYLIGDLKPIKPKPQEDHSRNQEVDDLPF